jgi:8-oxo-dGTP pyrophosphatase MutT (NUDIX family)
MRLTSSRTYYVPVRAELVQHAPLILNNVNAACLDLLQAPLFCTEKDLEFTAAGHKHNLIGFNIKLTDLRKLGTQAQFLFDILHLLAYHVGLKHADRPVFFEDGLPVAPVISAPVNAACSWEVSRILNQPLNSALANLVCALTSLPLAPSIPSASAILLSTGTGVYLSKRHSSLPVYPNHWQNPGGKIEQNEDPLFAALREVEEETGLFIHISRAQFLGIQTIEDPNHPLKQYNVYSYLVNLLPTEIPAQTEPNKAGPWQLFLNNELSAVTPTVPALPKLLPLLK